MSQGSPLAGLDPLTLFALAQRPRRALVAVSGGPDSIALLHLAARWRDSGGPQIHAATVDHDLRTGSRAEAEAVAREAARLVGDGKLLAVAGGGDTVSALNHAGVADGFSYVSTAGGAFLEWLEGKPLPGVDVLRA